jgi:hypothetical protein
VVRDSSGYGSASAETSGLWGIGLDEKFALGLGDYMVAEGEFCFDGDCGPSTPLRISAARQVCFGLEFGFSFGYCC